MTELRQGTGWRLDWRELSPPARSIWWDQLWDDAIKLRDRYRLVLRSAWWEDDIQVEALAALAALVSGYDTGAWNDAVSKLQLLFDLDRIRGCYTRARMSSILTAIAPLSPSICWPLAVSEAIGLLNHAIRVTTVHPPAAHAVGPKTDKKAGSVCP